MGPGPQFAHAWSRQTQVAREALSYLHDVIVEWNLVLAGVAEQLRGAGGGEEGREEMLSVETSGGRLFCSQAW